MEIKGIKTKAFIKKTSDCIKKYNKNQDEKKEKRVSHQLTNVYDYKCLTFNKFFKYYINNDGFVGFYDRERKIFIMMVSITWFRKYIINYLSNHLRNIIYKMKKTSYVDKEMVEVIENIINNYKTAHLAIDEAFNLYDKVNGGRKFFSENYGVNDILSAKKLLLGELYDFIHRYFIVRWGKNFSGKDIYEKEINGDFLYLISNDNYFLGFKTIFLYPLNITIRNEQFKSFGNKYKDINSNVNSNIDGNKYGKNNYFNRS